MAIDKNLYTLPVGMEDDESGVMLTEVDVETGEPTIVTMQDGSVEVSLGGDKDDMEDLSSVPFDANLAEYIEEDELEGLSTDIIALVEADIQSRQEWVDMYVEGLKTLGMVNEEQTEPWVGACGVHSTLLAEAVIRFQAETMSETFPAAGPVKTKIIGKETKEKEEAAARVKADMNYQLTERMTEYRTEHERLLYSLGLAGSAFKKVYYDPSLGRQVAPYIGAEDVIVPYGASTIELAERVTHVMRKTVGEVDKLQARGFYLDIDLGEPPDYHSDIETKKAEDAGFELIEDNRYAFYEVHLDTVIPRFDDEEELAKPYVITIDKGTGKVLSIYRNWKEDDPLMLKRQHFVHYGYVPGFGFYNLGLIHIIGGYAKAGTLIIRQLVDSGSLSNLQGGFKTRDLRNLGDDSPIAPGEWKDIDVTSGSIRDNIMPLPYKEPSQTLLALLDKITNEGRRLGAISDMNVSDMSANAPVGTTLAILERTLKPMAAVQARVHYAMKQEFKLLKAIISENAPMDYDYEPSTGEVTAKQSDYMLVDVIPVSDPNSSTMAQRVVQYQAVLEMATRQPEIYDLPQLHRQMIEVLGVKNADKLVPLSEDAEPADPISENMGVLVGKPLKAFQYQDHDAHLAAHQSFMQDPMIAQTIGQNPQAQQMMAALQAHIAEHLGFSYRKMIEEKLGVQLPPPGKPLPEEVEVLLSRVAADAGKQLTAAHQQAAAQQQAQQQMQDPNIQIAQEEAKTKRMNVERQMKKDEAELALKAAEHKRKVGSDIVNSELKLEEIAEDRRQTDYEAQRAAIELEDQRTELDRRTSIEALQAMLGSMNKPPPGNGSA